MFMVLDTAGRRIGPEVKPSSAFYPRRSVWRGGETGKLLKGKAINIRAAVTEESLLGFAAPESPGVRERGDAANTE